MHAMQLEQNIPSSVLVRVYVLGPLEIWKKDPSGTWKLVSKDTWKKNKPARSVFKRLLVQPGRRLARSTIEDDVWAETENFELTIKNVYNAISLIRGIIGKSLLTCWDAAYEIADQTLVWTDLDACSALLKEAENRGQRSIQTIPLLEQAVTLLERGELLDGESGKWCYAFRKRAEDMLRQARLWLAESYEMQGKLWQAGEQYRAMILTDPSDEDALQHWLEMLIWHGKRQEVLKCFQAMKDFMETQGFPLSNELEQMVASLNKQHLLPMISPFLPFEGMLKKTYILENQEMQRASRRHVLQQILGVVTLAQFPQFPFSSLRVQNDSIEEFLSCCEENILACWRLMKGNEIAVVPSVLCTWLSPLEPFARQSTPYQKQCASLAVQGYIIAGLVRVLHRDYDGAEWCCKQSLEYSEIAQDPNLKVAALKHLATKYNAAGYYLKTLRTYQEALPFPEGTSPLLQSRISLGLALSYARCQEEQQAWHHYELAQESFPEHPEHDPSFSYADCGKSSLNHYGGLMYLAFGQPEKAWEVFQEVVQLQQQTVIPERTVIEIVNCKAEAAIAQKDLDRACAHLQEGVQGAVKLKSEKRFHDSVELYRKAQIIWPHEPALQVLEELFH
jgi:tetratricopeptide (TPR) repeat protein